jgi:hypothetical protein
MFARARKSAHGISMGGLCEQGASYQESAIDRLFAEV